MFSMLVLIPTADNKISASKTSSPLAVFTKALTPLPEVSMRSTDALVMMVMPAFFIERSICFEMSSSSTGTIFGINSTMVTSVPIAL